MAQALSIDLEELIDSKVASGKYPSRLEVLRQALALLVERDDALESQQRELRREIALGVEQLDRGEGRPFDVEAIKRRARLLRDSASTPRG